MANNDKGIGDGRGILRGDYLNEDRPLTRADWLEEVFPEWGTLLNQQIENDVVAPGTVALSTAGVPSGLVSCFDNVERNPAVAGPNPTQTMSAFMRWRSMAV